jgi:hypothetical protein
MDTFRLSSLIGIWLMNYKGFGRNSSSLIESLFWHFVGRTEENHGESRLRFFSLFIRHYCIREMGLTNSVADSSHRAPFCSFVNEHKGKKVVPVLN